ncbi:MAG: tetratricopeptide repeat protein [Alphaproteobacteria bacterium]
MTRFILAIALMLMVSPAFAQEQAAPIIPKKPEVPFREDAGLISAEYYLSVGKYSQALSVLAGVLERHPGSADAYTYRGLAYQQLGDLKKARDNYNRAVTLNPTHLGANKYLASMFLNDGELDRAVEQMQVIRLACGTLECQELDELQLEINKFRAKQ